MWLVRNRKNIGHARCCSWSTPIREPNAEGVNPPRVNVKMPRQASVASRKMRGECIQRRTAVTHVERISFAERGLGPLRNVMKHLALTRHVQDDAATGMPVPGRVASRRDAKGETRKAEQFTMEIVPGAVTRKKQRDNKLTVTLIRSVPGSSNPFDVHCRVTCTGPVDCLLFTQPELMRAIIKQLSRTQFWSARDLIAPVLPVFACGRSPTRRPPLAYRRLMS